MNTSVVRFVVSCGLVVLSVASTTTLRAQAPETLPASLPSNITVARALAPAVDELFRRSGTFRRQCALIGAAAHVRVQLLDAPPRRQASAPRAYASINRYHLGLVRAVIEVPVIAEHYELIPHELEHVIEQIEGINLPDRARTGADGTVDVAAGVFETRRAREAGLTARREM